MKKDKEDKIVVKQFRDGSSNFWCDTIHYSLNKDGSVTFCSGGIDTEERKEAVLSFIRRNRKSFKERSASIFENEPREWSELTFGKFKGFKINEVETKYLKWLILNSADKKLIEEIKELLKIK